MEDHLFAQIMIASIPDDALAILTHLPLDAHESSLLESIAKLKLTFSLDSKPNQRKKGLHSVYAATLLVYLILLVLF